MSITWHCTSGEGKVLLLLLYLWTYYLHKVARFLHKIAWFPGCVWRNSLATYASSNCIQM